MTVLLLAPFFVQTLVILFDEFYFHVRRGLPKWERIGHPLDTLTVLACFLFVLIVPYSTLALKFYIALSIFSCIFVTKDEFVHKECCPASEQWLHALLFLNHPVVLTAAGCIWSVLGITAAPDWLYSLVPYAPSLRTFLLVQSGLIALFFLYQWLYWNFLWKEQDKALE